MWIMVNGFQIIYLTLAMKLHHTLHVHIMFSFLAFINLENEFMSNAFLMQFDSSSLESEPLNLRFDSVDIF